jgi:polar amino acid transport system substrate-binding protein
MGDGMSGIIRALMALCMWIGAGSVQAQTAGELTISTVTRAPFSMVVGGVDTGFSVDLLNAVAEELDLSITYVRKDGFSEMLEVVQDGSVDAALANISITAERERLMDFSQPIFESGVQVMMASQANTSSAILKALFTRQIGLAVLAALVLLFGGGMLMWVFERHKQPYFDRSARDAAFPAFWWALNLVVNGGFEERVPQSRGGRFFAVVLVISSLFIVSIFVAQITAALTISAIQSNIDNISDLEGRPIGTINGSTSATYLDRRGIGFRGYLDLQTLLAEFEAGDLDAVVFDGPILAYYVRTESNGDAQLLERVYQPENYGMAFQTGSTLREDVDQAMLRLREDGTYNGLLIKWFGAAYARR